MAPPSRASSALNCRRYPDTALTDFNGNPVRLGEQWPDGPTAIVFWSPTYGFCQRPLPDLRAREADRAPGAPRLLLVSSGSAAPQLSVSEDLCSVAFTRRGIKPVALSRSWSRSCAASSMSLCRHSDARYTQAISPVRCNRRRSP